MDFENMRLQEGILLDRMKVHIGVMGVCHGAGATFVSEWLDHYLNDEGRHRFFVSSPERYAVHDSPGNTDDMDLIIGVIDPMPSLLMRGADAIGELLDGNNTVLWILNRDNPGVNHRELLRYLSFRPEFVQSEIPREIMARAEYNGERLPGIRELEGIRKLAERIKIINA